tara:strand:+ start:617 stop:1417 length:801 start_codon:yes stop_codon:yes gene_type:complete
MRHLASTKELREKYNPDKILEAIDISYRTNYDKLRSSLSHPDNPLLKYNRETQISLLESAQQDNEGLIKEIADSLKDTVYFLTLSKKERTSVTQTMRSYHIELVKNQLARIEILIEDPEIGSPKYGYDPTPKHKGINHVFEILKMIQKDLVLEMEHWTSLSRAGYLTGLQISMGKFFNLLNQLGMAQKDQITLVQRLFDDFGVDWDEGDRESIKVSLQKSAVEYYEKTQKDLRQISSTFLSKIFSEEVVSELIQHAKIMKKRLRRF